MTRQSVRLEHTITAVLLGAMLSAPLVRLVVAAPSASEENRALEPFPTMTWSWTGLAEYWRSFNRYVNDHLGFKQDMVRAASTVRVHVLKTSTSANVVFGRDGWLGYVVDNGPRFTAAELDAWTSLFTSRAAWLASRGVRYLFVLAPDKQAVYPELFPGDPTSARRRQRLDQLVGALRSRGVEVLDLREALKHARTGQPLFWLTDTHWNQLGAFEAYRAIVQRVQRWFPAIHPLAPEDLLQKEQTFDNGDLMSMLGLPHTRVEHAPALEVPHPRAKIEGNLNVPGINVGTVGDPALPRLLMYRDSFAGALAPFIFENFSQTTWVWDPIGFDPGHVVQTRPNVVIQEAVERGFLEMPPPYLLPAPGQEPDPGTAGLVGYQNATECDGVTAWAWNAFRPEETASIDIYDGNRLIATRPANSFRIDLVRLGIGDGRHAMAFDLPGDVRDGREHVIRMNFAGTNKPLGTTMRKVTCRR